MMTRRSTIQLLAVFTLLATVTFAVEKKNTGTRGSSDKSNDVEMSGEKESRLREGMKLVNKIGELREAGGQIMFYPDGSKQSMQLLENLALERVSNDVGQRDRKWSISGIVTEYRGGNFILLHRAVRKARISAPSIPGS